jgi:heat shock protein HtpX
VTIVVVAAGLFFFQLFASDKIALATMGVQKVSPQEAPELHALIERLCVQADLPKPTIGIVNTQMPNAFAMGRSQKSATVVATTGLLELLSPAELEGVMAHELAHVRHRDVMIMTIASFFASIAALVLQFGFFFGGSSSDDDDGPSAMVLILVSLVVYVVSFVLMQALSRYREFAADRGAAAITGRPSALSSALLKISGTMERLPMTDLRAHSELNAFYIIPANTKQSLLNLFSTHPPVEQRIAQLSRLEAQLQAAR